MESSSEDNFAWTDTSSDQSENGVMANEQESDFDKSFKRKLQKELFKNGDHSEPAADEPRVKKKKKIKREPSSPSPVKRETNGHDAAAAERYLRLQVKQEQAATPATPASPATPPTSAIPATRGKRARSGTPDRDQPQRKKHKRDRAERDSTGDGVDAEEPPRKKKKKRKKATSDTEDAVIDKFEAEETVVQERRSEPRPSPSPAPRAPRHSGRELVREDSGSDDERPAPASPAAPTPAPRPLKIRERITFEEEPDEREERASGRLARYLRARSGLTEAASGAAGACVVGAHEDAWLVLAPRGLAAAALAGAALAPGARCRLRAAGRHYEALPSPAPARAALLAAGRLRGARLLGALRLRERVPRPRAPSPPPAPPASPPALPLPATRARHPLLGADCERAPAPAPARTPRRRRTSVRDPDPDPEEPAIPKKKKKKRDKPRRSPAPVAAWDSERAIEASLFGC